MSRAELERAIRLGFQGRHRAGVIRPSGPRFQPLIEPGVPPTPTEKAIRRAVLRAWIRMLRKKRKGSK